MQTFLPYADFLRTAEVLDYRRLGKQRVEALQLLRGQWESHPASKMWQGYEFHLSVYAEVMCREWISRGYKDTCLEKILAERQKFSDTGQPHWFGDDSFHRAHRSNLLRKQPLYYQKFFDEPLDLPYVWPSARL